MVDNRHNHSLTPGPIFGVRLKPCFGVALPVAGATPRRSPQKMSSPDSDTLRLSHEELCDRIEKLTCGMMDFWKSAHGWAPIEAAGLLNVSTLEWQSSLSESLRRWISAESDGDLILAWANLGALVEGQLKLFLSIYYRDYAADADAIRDRRGRLTEPDRTTIEPLRQFFVRRIWTVGTDWDTYVSLVQQRRNAIHAFRERELGSFQEWRDTLRTHLSFVRDINSRVPYPDSIYEPRET